MMRWRLVLMIWLVGMGSVFATSVPEYWTYTTARRAAAQGRMDQSVRLYTRLLANDPDNLTLMRSLADALYHKGEYAKAGELYAQINAKCPKSEVPDLWYNRGNAAFQDGRYPEAISWYRKTLSINPGDIQAKHNLELAQRRARQKNPPQEEKNPPPPPSAMLNAMDDMERESRRQRKLNDPQPPRKVEKDW